MSTQLEKLHALLQQVAFPETPEERDEAEKGIITLFSPDPTTPSVLRSPCCGVPVFIQNGWDGGDASAECDCGSEWGMDGKPTYWLDPKENKLQPL